jgi:hypothetical protein
LCSTSAAQTQRGAPYGCLFGLEKDGEQQYLVVPTRVSDASTMQSLARGLLIFLFL